MISIIITIAVIGFALFVSALVRLDSLISAMKTYHDKFARTNDAMHMREKSELFMAATPRLMSAFTQAAVTFLLLLASAFMLIIIW